MSNFNYFNRATVANATFTTDPDIFFKIRGNPSFSMINEGSGIIEYSFDGTTLHGDMVPLTGSSELVFNNRGYSQIWFRLKSGAVSNVRVEASEGTMSLGSAVPSGVVSGTVTANIGTSGSLALDGSITNLSAKFGSLGQKTMAGSAPVVIASDQSAIPISAASLPLPSGASTEATLTGGLQKSIVRGGVKGVTTAADVTSTSNGSDHNGLDTVEQFAPGYEDNTANRAIIEQRNSYLNITSTATTVVKAAPGFLHRITINSATIAAVITIYDNTAGSGTKIGTITMPAALLANQIIIDYDILFLTGLTIVTSVGAQDITVSYR